MCALAAGHTTLDERLRHLETSVSVLASSISGPKIASIGEFSARFERLENEKRDYELIIFGLLSTSSENCINTLSLVAASLGVSLVNTEVVCAFRISARASSSRSLIAKLTIIARRNELLACARRHRGVLAFDTLTSWPSSRISLLERCDGS
ncbi:hypothetical protein ALC57_05562 [Trachymyrmex cornetzi]|uniref:Uncharacterized protein n=1 Tax=Trachymyrmex cornetzi TaxID=471704 RepID=A0A151JAH1_9HYME|nr:hypothetical protein ALC57_05562 [Trachymyrmex cornetzi]